MEETMFVALMAIVFTHILSVVFLACFVVLVILKKWKLAVCSCVLSLLLFAFESYGFNSFEPNEDLTVASFSIRNLNENTDAAIIEVLNQGFDLVAFQETLLSNKEAMHTKYSRLGYHLSEDESSGDILVSKYPIESAEFVRHYHKAYVDYREGLVVYNIHAPKYTSNIEYYNNFYSGLIEDIKLEMSSKIVILLGDFNSVSNNYWRKTIENELEFKGALTHGGVGFINTFPGDGRRMGLLFPFVSIDEIYVAGAKKVLGEVSKDNYKSDHYPVFAKVYFH